MFSLPHTYTNTYLELARLSFTSLFVYSKKCKECFMDLFHSLESKPQSNCGHQQVMTDLKSQWQPRKSPNKISDESDLKSQKREPGSP